MNLRRSTLRKFLAPLFATTLMMGLGSPAANATVTIKSVSGMSGAEGVPGTTPTIYGGVAGGLSNPDCLPQDGDNPCDNCRDNGSKALLACNKQRIYASLRLKITINSDKTDGRPVMTGTNGTEQVTAATDSPTTSTKGADVTYIIPWQNLCSAAGTNFGNAACDPTNGHATAQFRIGMSPDNNTNLNDSGDDYATFTVTLSKDIGQNVSGVSTALPCSDPTAIGICYFEIKSGDEKAVVSNPQAINGFPTASPLNFRAIRVLYERGTDFTAVHPGSPSVDLAVSGSDPNTFSLSPSRITGLENEQDYVFKIASVDLAGNTGYYTPDSEDECPDANPPNPNCHRARPGEVFGVLESNKCFIATAAFGSPMAPQVKIFRQFRNTFLLTNDWGKRFVRFYYKHSPEYARVIAESAVLRAVSQVILWPFLGYAWLSLRFGTLAALLVTLLITSLITFLAITAIAAARSSRA